MSSLTEEQTQELQALIEQLKMAVNGDDKGAIEMRQKALQETYSAIMQADQQANKAANDSTGNKEEDVIDADFEDVSNG